VVGGFNPSENFVSWDDYSQYMESHKSHVPNHQPVMFENDDHPFSVPQRYSLTHGNLWS
jgi:uncharacterized short protein YbdD (DUF466 family)